jgi:hypothetical protein
VDPACDYGYVELPRLENEIRYRLSRLLAPTDRRPMYPRRRAPLNVDDRRPSGAGVGVLSERFVPRQHIIRKGKSMITTRLGRTGLEVTQLGYGSMGLRGPRTWGVRVVNDEDADRFLNSVLDTGINFIDTAPDYGISEERIGRYIGSRRSEFYLATKCGCVPTQHDDHLEINHVWKKEIIQRNIETSLRRLTTEYVDILQFHGADAETLQREGLIELLMQFRDQGAIRALRTGCRSRCRLGAVSRCRCLS